MSKREGDEGREGGREREAVGRCTDRSSKGHDALGHLRNIPSLPEVNCLKNVYFRYSELLGGRLEGIDVLHQLEMSTWCVNLWYWSRKQFVHQSERECEQTKTTKIRRKYLAFNSWTVYKLTCKEQLHLSRCLRMHQRAIFHPNTLQSTQELQLQDLGLF